MALTTIPSELSSVSGISDSSSSTAITIDSSQNVTFAGNITTGSNTISGVLASAATATTQAASDNSTKLATTAYVTTAVANLVDSAPGTLNTLNELAAALGDDANFSTTVTNSIAGKVALSGSGQTILDSADFTLDVGGDIIFDADGGDFRFKDAGTQQFILDLDDSANSVILRSNTADGDMIFQGNDSDGGGNFTALTLDMSEAGIATFNSGINIGNRGSASDPTLQSSIDPNTGIFWGGADILGFSTGGSERMRIDASGNVGIGTSGSLTHKLEVIGNALVQGTAGFNASNETANLYLGDTNSVIRAEYDVGTHIMTNNVRRLTVSGGTGNVGIGTHTPQRLLTLFNNDQPVFQITNNTSGGQSTRGLIIYQQSGTTNTIIDNQGSGSGGAINFYRAGTLSLGISATGTIFTGTNGIFESSSSAGSLTISGGSTNKGGQILLRGGNGDSDIIFKAQASTATPAEVARINNTGLSIGVGGVPLTALDVLKDSDHQVFLRSVTGNNQVRKGGIAGINYSGNQLAMLHYYSDAGTNYQSYGAPLGASGYRGPTQHRFYVASGPNGTTHYEKMRLDTGGLIIGSANVGGTTSADLEIINDDAGTIAFRRNEGAISNGEVIGQHYYTGDDPSATKTAHIDRVSAISNWSANNYPVKRSFWFDQGGNLLQSWYVYRATDGNVISEHIAGTNASASMRLSNDAITWQVDCRTDDHFAIYNQTAAQTRFFINTNGRTKFGSGNVTGTAIDTSGTVNGTSNAWSWSTKVTAGSGSIFGNLQHFTAQNPNNTTSLFQAGVSTAGTKYAVYSNGGLANFQSNNANLCDEREKKNIEATGSQWALVKGFDIKQFHYNDENDSDAKRLGVIAQEVEVNSPELITEWTKQLPQDEELWEEGDDLPEGVSVGDIKQAAVEKISRKGVKEQQVMWMAIKALQEAQTRIEALEAEVAALKGE